MFSEIWVIAGKNNNYFILPKFFFHKNDNQEDYASAMVTET